MKKRNLRRLMWAALLSNPFWNILDKLIYKQQTNQWVDDALATIRHVPGRLLAFCFLMSGLCVALLRIHRRRPPASHNTTITPEPGKLVINAPEPLFPIDMTPQQLTVSPISPGSLVLPEYPLAPFGFGPGMTGPSRFMNNSMMMQQEAARSQHNTSTRFGLN